MLLLGSSANEDKKSELNCVVINESRKVSDSSSLKQDASEHQSVNEKATKVPTNEEALHSSKNQDDKPVTTEDTESSVSVKTDKPNVSNDVTANILRRENCIYGKKCYR